MGVVVVGLCCVGCLVDDGVGFDCVDFGFLSLLCFGCGGGCEVWCCCVCGLLGCVVVVGFFCVGF